MGNWLSSTPAEVDNRPWYLQAQHLQTSTDSAEVEDTPWCLDPRALEQWYNDNVQLGTSSFDDDCRTAIDRVVRYIQRSCSTDKDLFDVSEVVKGGSLAKGTMVKDKSDVDLVAFINRPHLIPLGSSTPGAYRRQLLEIISVMKNALSLLPNVTIVRSDAYLLNFTIRVGRRTLDVDLLPAADNLRGKSLGDIYKEMLQLSRPYDRSFYSASLVKYQRDFVREQPGHVKELIRLVKYWAYTKLPPALQKSYPLELITIYCWEKAGRPWRYHKAQGLKDVLQTLTELPGLRHYWQTLYNKDLAERFIREVPHKMPILLDPANPSANVCYIYQRGQNMSLLVDAAEDTLNCTLLRDVIVHPNWMG